MFGGAGGDAAEILELLTSTLHGLTRTEITDAKSRHWSAARIDAALAVLEGAGQADRTQEQTGGRPAERWHATGKPTPMPNLIGLVRDHYTVGAS